MALTEHSRAALVSKLERVNRANMIARRHEPSGLFAVEGPPVDPRWSNNARMSSWRLVRVRPNLRTSNRLGGNADLIEPIRRANGLFALCSRGGAVGGDHGLVEGAERLNLDVPVIGEQSLYTPLLLAGEEISTATKGPAGLVERVVVEPAGAVECELDPTSAQVEDVADQPDHVTGAHDRHGLGDLFCHNCLKVAETVHRNDLDALTRAHGWPASQVLKAYVRTPFDHRQQPTRTGTSRDGSQVDNHGDVPLAAAGVSPHSCAVGALVAAQPDPQGGGIMPQRHPSQPTDHSVTGPAATAAPVTPLIQHDQVAQQDHPPAGQVPTINAHTKTIQTTEGGQTRRSSATRGHVKVFCKASLGTPTATGPRLPSPAHSHHQTYAPNCEEPGNVIPL